MSRFEGLGERFLADVETFRDGGGKVVGIYCTFAPTEFVRAAGAVPVGLCGKRQDPIAAAERDLPANLCPLIKSSYGYAVTDTCPYFAASDLLLGETTCDGKKKMFELLGRLKPMHIMHLPIGQGESQDRFWLEEMRILASYLEEHTGQKATEERLRREIKAQNEVRRLLKQVAWTSAAERVPLSGLDMMLVMEAKSFVADLDAYAEDLRALLAEIKAMDSRGFSVAKPGAPRILLTGCPVGKGSDKVLRLIEECGAVVVCQENCTGIKSFDQLVDEEAEPLAALAERYLRTPCSVLSPNTGRLELLGRLADEFRVQGVVDLTWHCCHTYNIEAHGVREFLAGRGLPMLHLETDYSDSDSEQLRTRIEAFLEMI
jgi:benzoyl-CoA reductase/2-hydroxyglutaryl-CoA dehydratase subunit BcrC/BadD/HgdB